MQWEQPKILKSNEVSTAIMRNGLDSKKFMIKEGNIEILQIGQELIDFL